MRFRERHIVAGSPPIQAWTLEYCAGYASTLTFNNYVCKRGRLHTFKFKRRTLELAIDGKILEKKLDKRKKTSPLSA